MAMFNSYVSWPEGTQYVLPILGLPKYPHDIPLAAMAVLPHKSSALVWANLVPLPRLRPRTGVPRQAQGEFQGIFMGLIVTISCFFLVADMILVGGFNIFNHLEKYESQWEGLQCCACRAWSCSEKQKLRKTVAHALY